MAMLWSRSLLRAAVSHKPWLGCRPLGTHPRKEPMEALNTPQGARDFIYSLHASERSRLLRELHRFESIAIAQASRYPKTPPYSTAADPVTSEGDGTLVFHKSMACIIGVRTAGACSSSLLWVIQILHPLLSFLQGTQIEFHIGALLGISTMAAAALGNLVSDLAGLGLAGYVEAISSRLGLPSPDLTPKQADMRQTRVSAHLGKAIGVAIGCLLGMFPLLFFSWEEEEKSEKKKK
ncbi:transmembrane protein 65 [Eleutherodactylus coqui]|uniref:transmembrane protein 65 n=1 Tax=Eleutherodactylus coqui TaxID=57060 RepID=UPI003462030E